MIPVFALGLILGLLAGLHIAQVIAEAVRQQPVADHLARELEEVQP